MKHLISLLLLLALPLSALQANAGPNGFEIKDPLVPSNEIVNDGRVMISFCPLCGTGVAFSADVKGEQLNFGVSGLFYNSDVLFYDRKTESLWSQLLNQAINGPL